MTHPTLPEEITGAPSLEEAQEKLGQHLGLPGPAPKAATERARKDALFARALHNLRNMPDLRDRVLMEAEAMKVNDAPSEVRDPSTGKVVKKAAAALLKWGAEGLHPSEPWLIESRLAACNACDKQVPAPETLIYRGAKVVVGQDAKICATCHCLTNTKAAIPTEKCPEKDPDNPELSRWGEPWVPVEEHPEGPW